MKHIAALLLSTLTLLTFGGSQAAERWGSWAIAGPKLLPAAREESWVPVGALGRYVANGAARVDVVPLNLEVGLDGPSSFAPQLSAAVEAIRSVVADDPLLVTNLKARGFSPEDVVGLNHSPLGTVTLFVTSQA
jgi:hypothetical protein